MDQVQAGPLLQRPSWSGALSLSLAGLAALSSLASAWIAFSALQAFKDDNLFRARLEACADFAGAARLAILPLSRATLASDDHFYLAPEAALLEHIRIISDDVSDDRLMLVAPRAIDDSVLQYNGSLMILRQSFQESAAVGQLQAALENSRAAAQRVIQACEAEIGPTRRFGIASN